MEIQAPELVGLRLLELGWNGLVCNKHELIELFFYPSLKCKYEKARLASVERVCPTDRWPFIG